MIVVYKRLISGPQDFNKSKFNEKTKIHEAGH